MGCWPTPTETLWMGYQLKKQEFDQLEPWNFFLLSLPWDKIFSPPSWIFNDFSRTTHSWKGHVRFVRLWSTGESELAQGWSPRLSFSLNKRETQYKGTLEGAFVLVDSPPLAHLSSFDHVGLLAHLFVLCLYLWAWCEGRHFLERPKYPIHLQCFPLQGHSNPHRPPSWRSTSGDRRKETLLFCQPPEETFPSRGQQSWKSQHTARLSKRANPQSGFRRFRTEDNL